MLTSQTRPGHENFGRDSVINVPPIARNNTPINEEALARAMKEDAGILPGPGFFKEKQRKARRQSIAVLVARNPGISAASLAEALQRPCRGLAHAPVDRGRSRKRARQDGVDKGQKGLEEIATSTLDD